MAGPRVMKLTERKIVKSGVEVTHLHHRIMIITRALTQPTKHIITIKSADSIGIAVQKQEIMTTFYKNKKFKEYIQQGRGKLRRLLRFQWSITILK